MGGQIAGFGKPDAVPSARSVRYQAAFDYRNGRLVAVQPPKPANWRISYGPSSASKIASPVAGFPFKAPDTATESA
jgi:hypothetical protein